MRLTALNLPGRRLALCALPLALMAIGSAHAAPPDCISGEYNTAGSTSCKLPAGITDVKIEAWGAGGGGGDGSTDSFMSGGGGGGGSYCGATFTDLKAGDVLNIVVGNGGSGGAAGDSSYVAGAGIEGSLQALGGFAGKVGGGGAGGDTIACNPSSATSFVGHFGGSGKNAELLGIFNGGGGGGSASEFGPGDNAPGRMGGAGLGSGGFGAADSVLATTGEAPGGGGGGGNATVANAGASGAAGRVKLTFTVADPEDGVCGTAHKPGELVTKTPDTALCSSGTASSVTTTNALYTWTCAPIGKETEPASCMVGRGYTVNASAVANGSVDPGSRIVGYGQPAAFSLTPASGYRPTSASMSGSCQRAVNGNSLLVTDVQSDCDSQVSFSEVQTQSSIPTQKSGVTATVEVAGCTAVTNVAFTAAPAQGQPANTAFPFGLLGFTATGCTGGDADVWVTYSEAVPAGAKFYKLIGGSYEEYSHKNRPTVISGNTVQFRVTDGSPADADGTVNGVIQDPAGVGVPSAGVVGIPTLSEGGMIILSGLLALGTFVTMRKRRV